jgi:hypothetical protein
VSRRTKDTLAELKLKLAKKGKKLGGPKSKLKIAQRKGAAANRTNADQFAQNTLPVIKQIQASGVTTLQGIATALAARGIPTARGGDWNPAQVANVLKRAQEQEGVVYHLPEAVQRTLARTLRRA